MTGRNMLDAQSQFAINTNSSIEGRFTFSKHRKGEEPVVVADFHNLITDDGLLQRMGDYSSYLLRECSVGSSSVPEEVTQKGVLAKIASLTVGSNVRGSLSFPSTGVRTIRQSYAFGEGAAAGNVREVAISPNSSEAAGCRALVRDAEGNPTSIPVASDEYLTVTYELTVYVDITDRPFTLNLSSGSHDCVLRPFAIEATSGGNRDAFILGLRPSYISTGFISKEGLVPVESTSLPGQYQFYWSLVSSSEVSLVDGVASREATYKLEPSQGNNFGAEGITTMTLALSNWLNHQITFVPPLPKNNQRVFTITLRFSVGRR